MRRYRLGLVVETDAGHATHAGGLATAVARDAEVAATWVRVPYRADDLWQRVPPFRGNWSLRASARARAGLGAGPVGRLDGLLFHTQLSALLSLDLLGRMPAVLSLDATPLNMDEVGAAYRHRPAAGGPLDRLKLAWNRVALRRAAGVIAWSEWVARSLRDDFGVDPARVSVIPPGVDLVRWRPGPPRPESARPRLLFVGGDFARKGGPALLEALRGELGARCDVDLVTHDPRLDPGALGPRVCVHRGLRPDDPRHGELFRRADLFVLPTRGDCSPLAILEALASGLPVIATRVGAIAEQVEHGVTGFVVDPDRPDRLATAIGVLLGDPARRRAMGVAARRAAEERFDAARNYPALLARLKAAVDAWPAPTGAYPPAPPPRRRADAPTRVLPRAPLGRGAKA